MMDPITEACRRVRDEIVSRSGGFDSYFDQLEELDRQRLAASAKRKARRKFPAANKKPRKRP